MITITLSDKSIFDSHADGVAFFLADDENVSSEIKKIADVYFADLPNLCKEQDFTGAAGTSLTLSVMHEGKHKTLMLFGLGKPEQDALNIESLRRALGSFIKTMQTKRFASCSFTLPAASAFAVSATYLAQQCAEIMTMAAYHFDEFITDQKRRYDDDLTLYWHYHGHNHEQEYKTGLTNGTLIGDAVNTTRYWIDMPPSALTPPELARKAKNIAKEHNLALTVFDEKEIQEMGMGGLSAVSAGSGQDGKLVVMAYEAATKGAPTIALVGKGITFDSGGLSLKPAQYMETMKEDMAGAAVVMSTMQAVAQLTPDINVIGITPLAENLPSGAATKPGDIIRFYNGKTAEVKNTDAEGRLILADALAYAVKTYKPDALIDIATLTGSCAHALGPFFTGLMGKDESLLNRLEYAATISGDRVWRLPFDDDYQKAIVSDVADICNIGKPNYLAGAITAGFFLSHFVGDTPWAHLDIAGTAYNVPDISYYRSGATGAGVRLFIALINHWQRYNKQKS